MGRTFFAKRGLLAAASMLAMVVAAGQARAVVFNFTGSEVDYTIPVTGRYDIVTFGAQGGASSLGASFGASGGLGAEAGGILSLTGGTTLTIFVGGEGQSGALGFFISGGGGGGSFVFESGSLLAAAGGGGGAGLTSTVQGGPGLAGTSGGKGQDVHGGAGGTNGNGGQSGITAIGAGGGGGGVLSAGIPNFGPGAAAPGDTTPPGTGGDGGGAGLVGGDGGFGGGGGGSEGGGGGGGYSGGGGGSGEVAISGGGGGGSFLLSDFTDQVLVSGVNSGNGFVSIAIVPEPSTWAMMLGGFSGLGALALLRKRKTTPV
jgi:PEP-CTERM motif